MQTYSIVRFYRERGRPQRVIKKGLTLAQAQEHCKRDDTRKEGVWFDGYRSEQ